ncbi:hypothetical protein [Streptomyces benahoarensis]|uniref:Uncharacterized protein n=1 Tax=Streptomyces benahoarensis TaxID=2595054 RepID=A0A553YWG0_9ACTN|nr:hypothetical protein [Streptomyces benahoarensis]TSB17769.1 hypothetical protein FNJ62_26475 [Streptomyces benahoarensis]TSB33531.1 hypothetical protein FNZ23_23410 [Streptomyces benahoarensis]
MDFFYILAGAALGFVIIAAPGATGRVVTALVRTRLGHIVLNLAAWGALGWLALLTYRSLLHALTGA